MMEYYWKLVKKRLELRDPIAQLIKGFYKKYNQWPDTLFLSEEYIDALDQVWPKVEVDGKRYVSPKESKYLSFWYMDIPRTVGLELIILKELKEPIIALTA